MKEYIIYLDGHEWRRVDDEETAVSICVNYDGDHEIWYEEENIEEK